MNKSYNIIEPQEMIQIKMVFRVLGSDVTWVWHNNSATTCSWRVEQVGNTMVSLKVAGKNQHAQNT